MANHRIYKNVVFECDECEDTFDTDTDNFEEAVKAVKDKGWRMFKNKNGDWEHYCSECR